MRDQSRNVTPSAKWRTIWWMPDPQGARDGMEKPGGWLADGVSEDVSAGPRRPPALRQPWPGRQSSKAGGFISLTTVSFPNGSGMHPANDGGRHRERCAMPRGGHQAMD